MNKVSKACRAFGAALAAAALWPCLASANHGPAVGAHPGYSLMTLRPAGFTPQVSGIEFLPNGDMLVLTWRGNQGPVGPADMSTGVSIPTVGKRDGEGKLYRLTGTAGTDRSAIKAVQVAGGFKDAQGLCVVDGQVYVGDIDRIVRLADADGDGKYESSVEIGKIPSYNGWFEYSFGPVHRDGRLYMALAVGVQSTGMPVRQLGMDRGSVVSVPITGGAYSVVAEGLRAPDGIGLGPEDGIFVTDNQGGWRPASALIHIVQDRFYGYQVEPKGAIQAKTGGVVSPPAIWMPYVEANESPTEPSLMKAGPFAGQFFYGDVSHGGIYRAFLEKVEGEWQGALFPFAGGLEVGVHRLRTGPNGEIYLGGLGNGMHSNQGWNETKFGLQKLVPNGTEVLEILSARSRLGGMELEFTLPVGASADSAANYSVTQWGYKPTADYGGPKQNVKPRSVKSVRVSADRRKVFIETDSLAPGQVVHIVTRNIRSQADGKALWFAQTWYTLNAVSRSLPFGNQTVLEPRKARPTEGLRVSRVGEGLLARLPGAGPYRISVLDFLGRIAIAGISGEGEVLIPAGALRPGLHLIRAEGPGQTYTSPFVL